MSKCIAEVAYEVNCLCGEAPAWDDKNKLLSWVDLSAGLLYLQSLKEGTRKTVSAGQYIGAAIPDGSGRYIAALTTGFYILDETGLLEKVGAPEGLSVRQRFNDAKCDPRGRLWAGTMSLYDDDPPGESEVYRLGFDNSITTVIKGTTISNGMAWSTDRSTFYFNDSPTMAVAAYDFDAETGGICNRRIAVNIAESGAPDGMTIDSEGMLWVAMFRGGCVCRYNPQNGRLLQKIELPTPHVTSCCFAGDDLETLYITTASLGFTGDSYAGNVFYYHTGIRGTKTDMYRAKKNNI